MLASAISTLNPKVIIHQYGLVGAVLGIDQLLSEDQSHKSKTSGYSLGIEASRDHWSQLIYKLET